MEEGDRGLAPSAARSCPQSRVPGRTGAHQLRAGRAAGQLSGSQLSVWPVLQAPDHLVRPCRCCAPLRAHCLCQTFRSFHGPQTWCESEGRLLHDGATQHQRCRLRSCHAYRVTGHGLGQIHATTIASLRRSGARRDWPVPVDIFGCPDDRQVYSSAEHMPSRLTDRRIIS